MRRLALHAVLLVLVLFLAAVAISTSWLKSFGGRPTGVRLERERRSLAFAGGTFHNQVPTHKLTPGSFFPMLSHQFLGDEERVPPQPVPVVVRHAADYAAAPASGLRATWIGHASTLVEIDGHRVLTDPIWSDRCSPSTWVGPRRFHPPPLGLDELPSIDVVVISHDHFDHLDMATIQALASRGTHFAVPLGVGAHLEAWGVPPDQMAELEWNETVEIAGLTLIATPARHYSGRNPFRSDETLWASWVVKGPAHRFFFSGDSGYFDEFKTIGRAHGPFDLALVKIGASDPTWVDIHMAPEDAVRTARDVGAALLLPVHWGTFNLAFHAWNEPPERALAAAEGAGVKIVIPRPGEFVDPLAPPPLDRWWLSP